jgi:hypothetical protein
LWGLLMMMLVTTSGCGIALTHYLCHKQDPVYGCDTAEKSR